MSSALQIARRTRTIKIIWSHRIDRCILRRLFSSKYSIPVQFSKEFFFSYALFYWIRRKHVHTTSTNTIRSVRKMCVVHANTLIPESSSKRKVYSIFRLMKSKTGKSDMKIFEIWLYFSKGYWFMWCYSSYGRRLVIVASQSLRTSLLLSPTVPRDIEISISNYCILERLARARYNGELANGKFSLADITNDPVGFHNQKWANFEFFISKKTFNFGFFIEFIGKSCCATI